MSAVAAALVSCALVGFASAGNAAETVHLYLDSGGGEEAHSKCKTVKLITDGRSSSLVVEKELDETSAVLAEAAGTGKTLAAAWVVIESIDFETATKGKDAYFVKVDSETTTENARGEAYFVKVD